MSTSDPSPSTELASSPGPADGPPSEDSGATTSDPVELAPADEPKQAASDLLAIEADPTQPSTPSAKKEPTLAESSIFDVSDVELGIFEAPIVEEPAIEAALVDAPVVEAPVVEAPVVEAPVVNSSSAEELEAAASDPLEEKPALAAFGDLAAFDALAPRAKRVSLPPLIPETPAPIRVSSEAGRPADVEEAEWELAEELTSVVQNEKPAEATQDETLTAATKQDEKLADATERDEKLGDVTKQDEELTDATAQAESPARPWRDVDDLEDDENSEDLTGIVHKDEPVAARAALGSRPWRDVDDLEDDEDDPSEYLPTQVLGVPAQTVSQRTLVPPPASRGAVRSRGPGAPLSLPAIPAPPTLPRSVPPSVPPVAFDWILERTGRRAGSLTILVAGLALLVVGILPLVVLGALVTGFFASENGSLVVTVAGANHGPVEAPVVVADDIPRCKESPCRITKLDPGTHFVRVTAPGYQQMAPRAVTVEKGGEVVLHVELAREPTRVTVAENAPVAPIDLDEPSVKVDALPRSGRAAVSTTASESVHTSTTPARAAAAAAAPTPAAGPSGTLNISSNPPSNVVLDGRPLGISPRAGIKVKPGPHQVVFIHPKLGRKNARANVKPGATSNVSVRFR